MTEGLTRRLGGRLAFGGDYNPEQWDEAVWKEDGLLMRWAHVNLATVGVFSWALLEPEEGRYDFGWLDAHLDRLHAAGVAVDLATPTASPPPWFTLAHPDAMPVTDTGVRLTHGSRDTYCLAAPAYRQAALRVATALAQRYGDHPAVAMWHVHNEYATVCWCDHTADAFRRWLRGRHGTLDALNEAWGTAFWSQRYGTWEEILPPRATQWHRNPALALDFRRFWSDEALAAYREQRDAIRAHTAADRPVTTNLMVPGYQILDLWSFGREVDVVGIDHYPDAPGTGAAADIAFGADRARSFGGGKPWLLVEQGANTVYTADRTLPKEPGDILRHSLAHIAHGSDGAMFFQWRQSKAGAEIWHSAMVPHAGPDSRIFREVADTGAAVARLGEVAGSLVTAQAAVLHDSDCWWALDGQGLPSASLDYHSELRRAHRALWDAGITADFAHPGDPGLSRYRLLIAPALPVLSDAAAESLRDWVHAGGTLLVQHFAGVVDTNHQARLGGYPAQALRTALGVRVEEFRPLAADAALRLSDGSTSTAWSESLRLTGRAEAVAAYTGGMLADRPALTRHAYGAGTAWYASTRLDDAGYDALVARVSAAAGVGPELPLPTGVEAVRRHAPEGPVSWLFLLNHTDSPATVEAAGHDLLTGRPVPAAGLTLPPGGAAVLRQE
ncbi:beta-galactosidase [Actinacidiphila bryophytorum]|uniref:Beta-galactosidase n=2 Tax=Actinacidiphila bryophytorum TaxID=1436133 RepID=A0A9W4MFK3_9ACTN|nr:beta-galactosidase [Actinacidiphila bryophytorum]MBM9435078.1 beta-galactosidase [Actinacidiphila bryophytorum]CAG7642978.1 Beta-galactosidase [Actinacidiphila bryophytorum]